MLHRAWIVVSRTMQGPGRRQYDERWRWPTWLVVSTAAVTTAASTTSKVCCGCSSRTSVRSKMLMDECKTLTCRTSGSIYQFEVKYESLDKTYTTNGSGNSKRQSAIDGEVKPAQRHKERQIGGGSNKPETVCNTNYSATRGDGGRLKRDESDTMLPWMTFMDSFTAAIEVHDTTAASDSDAARNGDVGTMNDRMKL